MIIPWGEFAGRDSDGRLWLVLLGLSSSGVAMIVLRLVRNGIIFLGFYRLYAFIIRHAHPEFFAADSKNWHTGRESWFKRPWLVSSTFLYAKAIIALQK
jgi:hypothetical protein